MTYEEARSKYFVIPSNSKKIELECEEEPEEFDSDSDLEIIRSEKTDSGLLTSLESQSSTTTNIIDSQ